MGTSQEISLNSSTVLRRKVAAAGVGGRGDLLFTGGVTLEKLAVEKDVTGLEPVVVRGEMMFVLNSRWVVCLSVCALYKQPGLAHALEVQPRGARRRAPARRQREVLTARPSSKGQGSRTLSDVGSSVRCGHSGFCRRGEGTRAQCACSVGTPEGAFVAMATVCQAHRYQPALSRGMYPWCPSAASEYG